MSVTMQSRQNLDDQEKEHHSLLDLLTGAPATDADERFSRDDLRRMSAAALWRELVVIHLRLALGDCPRPWSVERYRRIRRELRSRDCPTD